MSGALRWLLRGLAALAALGAVGLAALVWALPRFVESEQTRARIASASRDALGRELRYESLGFGLFPPSLQVEQASLAGETRDAPPLARADRVELRAGLLPLLRGELEVRSLVAEGLALHLVRTAEGFVLPKPAAKSAEAEAKGESAQGDSGSPADAEKEQGMALAIRRVLLRDTDIVVEDRAVRPPQTWHLRDLQLEGRPEGTGVALEGSFALESGGSLELDGRADLIDGADLRLDLKEIALAPLGPYLGERVAGSTSGALFVTGALSDPALRADLDLVDAHHGETTLAGTTAVEAKLEHLRSGLRGPFTLDWSRASLAGGSFTKPAGTKAVLSGQLMTDASGAPGVDDLRLELRNLVARGTLRTAPKTTLELAAEPFEVEGWERLIPALALLAPTGRFAAPKLTLKTAPLDARGLLRLEQWVAKPPGRDPIALDGQLELLGNALRSRDLTVRAADQPFQVQARIDELFSAPRYAVDFETAGADVDALLSAFAGQPNRLRGPLVGKGHLEGPLGGPKPFLDALKGDLQFDIQQGQIVGVSLLESALGPFVARLAEASRDRVRGDLKRFYGEAFESLAAKLHVQDGKLVGEPISLVYEGYATQLEGNIELADLSLDLRGSVTILEKLDATLAKAFGAKSDYQPRRRTLPVAAVRGKLGAPKVQLAGSSVEAIASSYAIDAGKEQLKQKVEKQLGPGTGQIVDEGLRAIEGLFGRKPAAPAPSETPPRESDPPPADR